MAEETKSKHRLLILDTRLAFPNLWTKYKNSYGARFILPPTHKQLPQLKALMLTVAKEKWGAKAGAYYKALEVADKLCLHSGDLKAEYEGFEGNLFISANSKTRPNVFLGRTLLEEDDGVVYSGCYVNANIEVWAQEHKEHGKRINAGLRGVQFLRKGDAFGGGSAPADADEFPEIDAEGLDDEEVDITA